jgi:hypothetical protein
MTWVDFGGHLKDFLLNFMGLMEKSKECSDFYLLLGLLSNKILTLWILTCNKINLKWITTHDNQHSVK